MKSLFKKVLRLLGKSVLLLGLLEKLALSLTKKLASLRVWATDFLKRVKFPRNGEL